MFRTRSVSRSTVIASISFVLLAGFLVAVPLGGSADARKCTPSGPHCGGPVYCDDVGVTITGTDFPETIYGTSANDIILAKAGDDIIYGGGGDDVICGGDGKDTIFGEDGNDIIYPNKGNDIVDGGAGADAIAFNDDTSDLKAATVSPFQFGVNLTNESGRTAKNGYAVVVDLEAIDVPGSVCATTAKLPDGTFAPVGGCVRNDGYGQFDQILADASGVSSIEDVTGPFFPMLGGNQLLVNGLYLRSYLVGNRADNYLTGSGGADYLAGHGGQDTVDYWLDSPGVSVNLSIPCPGSIGGCGTDGRGSKDALIGIEDVNGTRYDDHITGDSGPNVLDGGSTYFSTYNGNDVISGGNGDDILLGGTGTNTLDGGSGTDLADYSNEPGLGGIDFDMSVIGPKSPGFSTDDMTSVEGVIGTPSADHLTGDATGNVLNGAGGNDVLSGGGAPGGQSKDVLVGGSGTDTVSYSTTSGSVSVSLGLGTAGGTDVHETLTQIENAVGSDYDDELTGTHGVADVLDGAAGTDTCYARTDAPPAGDLDQAVNCEDTPDIVPAIPINLSTDQTGDAPVLHGSFSVVDGGSGSVVYTVWDADPDQNPSANVIVPLKSGTPVTLGGTVGTITRDSPLSLAGVPLVDGQTYYWKAISNDGVGSSPPSEVQSFAVASPINCFDLPHENVVVYQATGIHRGDAVSDPGMRVSYDTPTCTRVSSLIAEGDVFNYVEIGWFQDPMHQFCGWAPTEGGSQPLRLVLVVVGGIKECQYASSPVVHAPCPVSYPCDMEVRLRNHYPQSAIWTFQRQTSGGAWKDICWANAEGQTTCNWVSGVGNTWMKANSERYGEYDSAYAVFDGLQYKTANGWQDWNNTQTWCDSNPQYDPQVVKQTKVFVVKGGSPIIPCSGGLT